MKAKLFLGMLCLSNGVIRVMDFYDRDRIMTQALSFIKDDQDYFLKAVTNKNYAEIVALLAEGNDINATYNLKARESGIACKRRPIERAFNFGNYDVAKFLIEKGADVTLEDEYNKTTSLHNAVISDDLGLIALLIQKGARINAQDVGGNTPSHTCLYHFNKYTHYYPILLYLITQGADILIPNSLKYTVLYKIKACSSMTDTQKKELLCEALKLAKIKQDYPKEKLESLEEAYAMYS